MAFLVRLWAIAAVTLREASRGKVFFILPIFAAVVMLCIAFFPSIDAEGRLRLAEVWALRASALFAAIAALWLGAFSLPADFEKKRIYLLASKPVFKSTVFLGKFTGFVVMLVIFVGGMGVITIGFLRGVQLFGGEDFPPLVAYPRVEVEKDDFEGHGARKSQSDPDKKILLGDDPRARLVWRFKGLRRSDFPETARAVARFTLGGMNDKFRASGDLIFRIGPLTAKDAVVKTLFMSTNRDVEIPFPSRLIDDEGTLLVLVGRVEQDTVVVADPKSVQLYEKSDLFELNFMKGMGLIFLQSLLILALTMTASTMVSAPLSIILGIMLYITGNVYTFVEDGVRTIDRGLKRFEKKQSKRTPEDLPPWMLRISSRLSQAVLAVIPNFDHFDFSKWLLRDRAIAWKDLAGAAMKSVPHILVIVVAGMLLMIFKAFG